MGTQYKRLPLVSVLIPAYNSERWIGDAIKSALSQTWPNIEVIVVDDGSSDGTLAVARQYGSERLRVLTQPNRGASAARNLAISACQGDYIQWLDSDDLLAPGKVKLQMERAESVGDRQRLISSSWARFYYRLGAARLVQNPLCCNLSPLEWLLRKMEHNAWMAIQSWLVSRELSDLAGPWNPELSADDDGDYVSRLVAASSGVDYVDESISYVRRSNFGSLSGGLSSRRKLESQLRSMEWQMARVNQLDDSPRFHRACVTYLQNWYCYFCLGYPDLAAKMRELAIRHGGMLSVPRLGRKYYLIQLLFGYRAARQLSTWGSMVNAILAREAERIVFAMEQ